MGLASSNRYEIRSALKDILDQGLELSEAVEMLTGKTHVKTTLGMSGIITGGAIDRSESYRDAIILAFSPFTASSDVLRLWCHSTTDINL
jgi:non-canonical (house-cleaning) NTP pyrophosphatase